MTGAVSLLHLVTGHQIKALVRESDETGSAFTEHMEMPQKEGRSAKEGSKWRIMPDQMIRYRAATFLGRLYYPCF